MLCASAFALSQWFGEIDPKSVGEIDTTHTITMSIKSTAVVIKGKRETDLMTGRRTAAFHFHGKFCRYLKL